ncbi:hypothetical protein D3C74_448250 [compost metagenome]
MIVYDIHNHGYPLAVQGLHHFLHFADTGARISRIGAVRPLRHVIVLRVISPVIFAEMRFIRRFNNRSKFVYGLKISYRHQMHMRDAQVSQMIYTNGMPCGILQPEFSKSLEFALMPHA